MNGAVATATVVTLVPFIMITIGATSMTNTATHMGGIAATATSVLVPCIVVLGTAALATLQSMHLSVGVDVPTPKQLQEEDHTQCALFRHIPQLKTRLAWRQLSDDTFPTPVHRGTCSARPVVSSEKVAGADDKEVARTVQFYVKREDLSSSEYGGNKVRTLQHQLAVMEAKIERGGPQRDLVVFGSGGSNQVVATIVHAAKLKLAIPTTALWMADPPDLDNALNMLSSLSFHQLKTFETWGNTLALVKSLIDGLVRGKAFVLPLGGNNPSGVLGQVGGILELAEQIEAGDIPDCDGIYVPVGSACTISGLIMGVALSRKLGLKAFRQPEFALHPVSIHHAFAFLNRVTGLYKSKFSRYIPLTVRHSIHATCSELTQLGGPDILAESLAILQDETVVHDDAHITGDYGAHSEPSLACAQLFDETCTMTRAGAAASKEETPGLWLCGHFTAKAMAAMCDDLLKEENAGKNMVFWQTKSLVQPRGPKNEWEQMQQMPPAVQTWAEQGHSQSERRPGKVDLRNGSTDDYRGLMTEIDASE